MQPIMSNQPKPEVKKNIQGFYKAEDKYLHYAPNGVLAPTYELTKEKKDTYTFPIEGWYWFEGEDEARKFFNLPLEENTK